MKNYQATAIIGLLKVISVVLIKGVRVLKTRQEPINTKSMTDAVDEVCNHYLNNLKEDEA